MPDPKKKIDSVYDALSQDPNYEGIGTREQFTKAMSDSATARRVHDALSKDENYEGIGNFDQFYKAMNDNGQPPAAQTQAATSTDQQAPTDQQPAQQPVAQDNNLSALSPDLAGQISTAQNQAVATSQDVPLSSDIKSSIDDTNNFAKNIVGRLSDDGTGYVDATGKPITQFQPGQIFAVPKDQKLADGNTYDTGFMQWVQGADGTFRGRKVGAPDPSFEIAKNNPENVNVTRFKGVKPNDLIAKEDALKDLGEDADGNPIAGGDAYWNDKPALKTFVKGSIMDGGGKQVGYFLKTHQDLAATLEKEAESTPHMMESLQGQYGLLTKAIVNKYDLDNDPFKGKMDQLVDAPAFYKNLDAIGKDQNDKEARVFFSQPNNMRVLQRMKDQETGQKILNGIGSLFPNIGENEQKQFEESMSEQPWYTKYLSNPARSLYNGALDALSKLDKTAGDIMDKKGTDSQEILKNASYNQELDQAKFNVPKLQEIDSYTGNRNWGNTVANFNNDVADMTGGLAPTVLAGGEGLANGMVRAMAFGSQSYQTTLADYREKGVPEESAQLMAAINGGMMAALGHGLGGAKALEGFKISDGSMMAALNPETKAAAVKAITGEAMDYAKKETGGVIKGATKGALEMQAIGVVNAMMNTVANNKYKTALNEDIPDIQSMMRNALSFGVQQGATHALLMARLATDVKKESWQQNAIYTAAAESPNHSMTQLNGLLETLPADSPLRGEVEQNIAMVAKFAKAKFPKSMDAAQKTVAFDLSQQIDEKKKEIESVDEHYQAPIKVELKELQTKLDNVVTNPIVARSELSKSQADVKAVLGEQPAEEPKTTFEEAGNKAKESNDGKVLGKWILNNGKVGDTITLKDGSGYEITEKGKDGSLVVTPFDLNDDGTKDYNHTGVKYISDKMLNHGDLFETAYNTKDGKRVVEQYKYNTGDSEGKKSTEEPNKLQVGKPIIEPSKPITEMTSEEISEHAKDVKAALKKQDLEFADKTEAEKEAGGYNDTYDNYGELRDLASRVNHVENSEDINDLAGSVKAVVVGMDKDKPSQEALTILNAAKRKAAEMGIEPKDLVKEVMNKVGTQYKDFDDAETMMHSVFDKLTAPQEEAKTPQETESETDTYNNGTKYNDDGSIEHVTHDGKYRLVAKDGDTKAYFTKDGKEVGKDTKRKIIAAAVDAHDFSGGERAEFPEGVHMDEHESDLHTIEHTQSPSEVAQTFLRQEPDNSGVVMSEKEAALERLGVGNIKPSSFARFDDKNNQSNTIARTYFGKEKGGTTLDQIAHEASTDSMEITPQDVADYMKRFYVRREEKKTLHNHPIADAAKEKFLSLTGLPLDEKTAQKAIDQETASFDNEYQKWSEELQQKQLDNEQQHEQLRTENDPAVVGNDSPTAKSVETTGDAQQAQGRENARTDSSQTEPDSEQRSGQGEVDETGTGDDSQIEKKSFETKVDEAASKIKNLLSSNVIRELKAQGKDVKSQGIDTDKIVDAAAKIIKAAYHAKEDIRAAIEDAIDHIKAHINLDGQAEDHVRAEFSLQADALENKRHLPRATSMLKDGATDDQVLLHLDRKGVPFYNAIAILGDAKEAQLTPEDKGEALKEATKKYNDNVEDKWLGKKGLTLIKSRLEAKRQQDEVRKTAKDNSFLRYTLEEAETPEEKQKIRGAMEAAKNWRNIDRAIHIHLDLKRNPSHYEEYYNGLTDKQKNIADLANNLSPEQTKVADDIADQYKQISQLSIDNNLIKEALDNYVSRAWDFNGKAGEETFKFATNTRHTIQRSLDTILQGQAEGMKLKIEGATNNLQALKVEINNVLENKKLIQKGFDLKIDSGKTDENGKPIKQSFFSIEPRDGYAKIENPFFKKWDRVGKVGEGSEIVGKANSKIADGNLFEKKEIYAPKDVAKSLNNILGKSVLQGFAPVDATTKFTRAVKMSILSASFYHHIAFTRAHYLSAKLTDLKAANPIAAYKEGLKMMHENLPEFDELADAGLTIGRQQDWTEGIAGRGDGTNNKFFQMVDTFHKNLFENYGAGLKSFDGVNLYRHELIKNSKLANPLSREMVAKNVAKLMNDTYGGENWARMRGSVLQNPTFRHSLSLGFLAPDWTVSNLRLVGNSFKGDEGKIYRNMWARVLLRGAMTTITMNALMTMMDDKDDNGNPLPYWEAFGGRYQKAWESGDLRSLAVDMSPIYHAMGGDETQRAYFSVFGAYTDPLKAINNPIQFMENKFNPSTIKMPLEALTGENWQHKRFTDFDEMMGNDNKGSYAKDQKEHKKGDVSFYSGKKYTSDQKGYTKGDEKGGKLTGQLTKFDYTQSGPISYEQAIPFALAQVRGMMPTAIQSLSQGFTGENDWAKTALSSVGTGTMFDKEGKKDKGKTLWNLGAKIVDKINK